MADAPGDITRRSLSTPLVVASLLLCAAFGWAVYDESVGQRPWKDHQARFRGLFTAYLRNRAVASHGEGAAEGQVERRLRSMQNFPIQIRQIYVPESGLVDRCESCHLGVREPLAWNAEDDAAPKLFARHPNPELLRVHDPERFGCSLCHNGNGAATSSVEKAHGLNAGWPWPLFDREHREAGCLPCHRKELVLDDAPVLSRGRDLYTTKGCAACHRYEEFDREADGLLAARDEIRRLRAQAARDRLDVAREIGRGDDAPGDEQARQHYARATSLRIASANVDARLAELAEQVKSLEQERANLGPALNDARVKLRKAWIPQWLNDPQAFRPGTPMPHFRLSDEERRAVAAFVWQLGEGVARVPAVPRGDAARGRTGFETRGCLACHAIGEREPGGDRFAANLSRLGEKADYDYLAHFIHDPSAQSPGTRMPGLRLSWPESRDIATYLVELKRPEVQYPTDLAFMDDPRIAESGRAVVNRYGCANCHEIRSFENAQRVGTELTRSGDKRVEQFDFGLLATLARREGWYSTLGFIQHKLIEPAIYDRGREKVAADRLRMPDIALTEYEVRALATFLIGSVDPPTERALRTVPAALRSEPIGAAKDLQAGWWIVKKYNCQGCHAIHPTDVSTLSTLPRYQDPDEKEKLPPALHQEGARVNPAWLAKFLENPALSVADPDRNGVRPYLQLRMPTFNFSPNEIRVLVRFFEALSGQAAPYLPPRLNALDDRERQIARTLFSSQAAVCVKCHVVGQPAHDRLATAPDLLLTRERLKPDWTLRWTVQPQEMAPGTAMPANLFRWDRGRWVFANRAARALDGYPDDHAQLVVRYMFELTPDEQRRLVNALPAPPSARPTADRRR